MARLVVSSPLSELAQIKSALASGPRKAYWDDLKGDSQFKVNTASIPNWSGTVTFNGVTFDPKRFVSTELPDQAAVDAEGSFIMTTAQNAYGCALRWYFDGDAACGTHALTILDAWSANFAVASCRPSGIDIRENQIKLWSGWSVPAFIQAAELLWEHPGFTAAKKAQFADWLWRVFLLQTPVLAESDGEILGMRFAGWNGRASSWQSRLWVGLVMKAASHARADEVLSDIVLKLADRMPEILYYGKAPWHEVLGQPWPKQPYRHVGPTYGNFHQPGPLETYWHFAATGSTPPAYFVGMGSETGRDLGHTQMGVDALAKALRAMRLNGLGDRYVASDLGSVMLQLGERHARFYNEALDAYWANPSAFQFGGAPSIEGLSCGFSPSGWPSGIAPFAKSSSCPASAPAQVTFKIGGGSADHGWEYLRMELKAKAFATPELDRLTHRLRGVGTRSTSNVAGSVASAPPTR
ncbi:MAG: hypothetical protein IPJ65_40500 [Archangiaceae bacterium]|nr:hypothetical protein [Archangiaceae bacterium]